MRELYKYYQTFACGFEASFTHSGSGGSFQVVGAVNGYSEYTIDAEAIDYGFRLYIQGAQGTGPNPVGTEAGASIPILGWSDTWSLHATNLVSGSIGIEIDALAIFYQDTDTWLARWSEIRILVNGSTVHTIAGDTVEAPHGVPSGMPFLGIPFKIATGSSFTPEPSLPVVPSSPGITPGTTTHVSVTSSFNGECTVEDEYSVAPEGFPVRLELLDPPEVDCPCEPEPLPALSCSNTESFSGEASTSLETVVELVAENEECPCVPSPGLSAFRDVYANRLVWKRTLCDLQLFPDLDCEVLRFDPDNHQETIRRAGFPAAYKTATTTCQTAFPAANPGDIVTEVISSEVYPRQSEYLAGVGGTTHAFEDTLSYNVPAPASRSSFVYRGTTHAYDTTMGACPPGSSTVCPPAWEDTHCAITQSTAYFANLDDRTDNPDIAEYLDHVEDRARLVNTWGSRLWSYRPYFPPDEDEEGQDTWPINGAKIPIAYWMAKGDQWQNNGAAGETTGARTTLISDPLLFKRVSPWGWGNANFKVLDLAPLPNYTFSAANSSLFTLTNCTSAYGSTIELTPDPGETEIVFEIALGTWPHAPRMLPHFAKEFTVGWQPTNIDNVLVELVSQDDSVVTLTDNIEGTFAKPIGTDTKYAGDHTQNYGCGFITDTGVDLRPNGVSSTYMTDPELVHAFSLLGGRTAKALRFTVTVVDPDDPVELDWPSFATVDSNCLTYQLNRSNAALIWEDGPGIRFGNTTWYYDDEHKQTPRVLPPGYPFFYPLLFPKVQMVPTGTDILSFENQFLLGEAHDDDFAAKIAARWDVLEAIDAEELDDLTIGFLIPSTDRVFPRAAITNRCAVPPCLGMPQRGRDSDFVQNQAWKQEVWTHAVEPRFYVGDFTTHLVNPGDASMWTSAGTSLSPWTVTYHRHAVDNSEGLFQLRRGALAIGTLRPWNGGFSIRNVVEPAPGYPSLCCDIGLDGRRIRAWRDGDDIVKIDLRDPGLTVRAEIDTGITAEDLNVSVDRQSSPVKVWLVTEESGSIYFRISTDGGYTYGSPTLVGTGMHPRSEIGLHGLRYLYWYESGAIKGRRYSPTGTALESEFTAIATADDNSFDVTNHPIGGGKNHVVIDYVVGGVRTTMTSQDGITFA